jgi:hypothetical protein
MLVLSLMQGMVLRGAYDLLVVFRRLVRHRPFWIHAEDLICCAIGGLSAFRLFYLENAGTPRGFALVGIFAGMALYHWGPSRVVCYILEKILRILIWPIGQIKIFFKKVVKCC